MNNDEKSIEEEIKMIKKQAIKVLFSGFLVALLGLIYWVYFHPSILVEGTSPLEKNEVIIKEYGNGPLNGGNVKFYFKKDGKTVKTKKVSVDNIKESNHRERYNFSWKNENEFSVGMRFEQSTKSLTYNFSNNSIEFNVDKQTKWKGK